MKRFLILCFALLTLPSLYCARKVNYDEQKIPKYTLPDIMRFSDGSKVKGKRDWPKRRQEILNIFQREMYGQIPPKCDIVTETIEEGLTLANFGWRRQIRMWFGEDKTGPKVDWLIITPRHAKGRVPVILFLNYLGNASVIEDSAVFLTDGWLDNSKKFGVINHRATERTRAFYAGQMRRSTHPIGMLLARGYAVVTACYAEISPDPEGAKKQDEIAYTGIFDLWGERDKSREDNTTALGAWAWTLMRGMDMIENDSILDSQRVLLTGYSRLAKAALIAGAYDERFPVIVPVQTGGGGVPLAKHFFGENVSTMNHMFTHWYCHAFRKYADNEAKMPFDQHMLLACIAPRALLVEGFNEPWFDTRGEFLALQAASPIWKMLGKKGLPDVDFPDNYDTSAIGPFLGYVRRTEQPGFSVYDWKWMLDFADKVWKY